MIDFKEIGSPEVWELFARDYLVELGFVVEVPPGRGADQGRDLVVSEQLTGKLRTEKFAWLVSCKFFTQAGSLLEPQKRRTSQTEWLTIRRTASWASILRWQALPWWTV